MPVKASIVRIGNSRGVRLPKALLEESGLAKAGVVELEVSEGRIVISAEATARRGWGEAFAAMAARGEDQLLAADSAESTWDREEWEW
jgi:antitoxin MazE